VVAAYRGVETSDGRSRIAAWARAASASQRFLSEKYPNISATPRQKTVRIVSRGGRCATLWAQGPTQHR
jgi:hypothetical protein